MCVCEPTVTRPVEHASRSADHESGAPPWAKDRPVVHERRREVQVAGMRVPHEDRQRDVDEVGRAVVERHDDAICGIAVSESGERLLEPHHLAGGRELLHLLVEILCRQVDRRSG